MGWGWLHAHWAEAPRGTGVARAQVYRVPPAWTWQLYNRLTCCLVTKSCLTLQPRELKPTGFLYPWDSPGKNTEEGCHFPLQEIFPTQGLNSRLPHCADSLPLSHLKPTGWLVISPKIHVCLEPQDVTLFGKKVFADVIKTRSNTREWTLDPIT